MGGLQSWAKAKTCKEKQIGHHLEGVRHKFLLLYPLSQIRLCVKDLKRYFEEEEKNISQVCLYHLTTCYTKCCRHCRNGQNNSQKLVQFVKKMKLKLA